MPVDIEVEEKITPCTGTQREEATHPQGGGNVSMDTHEANEKARAEQERFEDFYRQYEDKKYEWFDQLAKDRDRLAKKTSKLLIDRY